MVIRERYLKLIRPFYDQELIKVLIGIRRSGKSVILKQIIDELKENNVDDNHIIYINFEDYDYEEYTDPKKLNNYVKERIIDDKKYYIFFDEIQNVDKWEKVVNSLRATKNTSIFITGSNSKMTFLIILFRYNDKALSLSALEREAISLSALALLAK